MLSLSAPSSSAGTRAWLRRPFGPFWAAVTCSDLADGAFRIVLPLLALAITHSAVAVSAVGVAARLPWLIVTLPAGVVADRSPPRSVMRWAAFLRLPVVAVAGALAFAHELPVWGMVVVAFAVSSAGTFIDVAAQSLLPRLVDTRELRAANQRLQSTQRLASQLIGPAIGGYAAALGSGWGPGAAAVLYVVVVVVLGGLSSPVGHAGAAPSSTDPAPSTAGAPGSDSATSPDRHGRFAGSLLAALADLRETATYFRGRADLSRLAVAAGLGNLSFSMCVTILPVWAVAPGRLGLSEGLYGLLFGSLAVGGLAGSVFAGPALRRLGDPAVVKWGALFQAATFLALAVPSAPVACVALVYGGAAAMLWNIAVVTYRQTTISREVFGRIVAVYRWVTWGVLPVGSLLAGLVAELVGTAWVFVVAGLLMLIGGLQLVRPGLLLAPPRADDDLGHAATGPAGTRTKRES